MIMLEVEALGKAINSKVFQIGAMGFEFASGGRVYNGSKSFNKHICPESCVGEISSKVMAEWLTKSQAERTEKASILSEQNIEGRTTIDVLGALNYWPMEAFSIPWKDIEGLWVNNSSYLGMLELQFIYCGQQVPWEQVPIYDLKTLHLLLGIEPGSINVGLSYLSVDDCEFRIMRLQKALKNST